MASLNYTVEDSSPLIVYSPPDKWIDAGSNDTLLSSYSGSSYHFSNTKDASASFQFNGTGVSIFGAKRPNYGDYTITVDGNTVVSNNAGSTQAQVKQLLGSATNLSYGSHTVVLFNSGTSTIDIDSIEVETRLSGEQVTTTMIDDNDSRISYSPSDDWQTNARDIFFGNTLHFSQTNGANASLSFTGEAVAVYGTTSPDHADIRVVVDGQTQTFNGGSGGRTSGLHTQVLLCYVDSLGPGQHTLSVTNDQTTGTGPFIDLDAVFVYSSNGSGTTGNNSSGGGSAPSSGQPASSGSSSIPTGTIVGAAVGGTVGLILILALLHFLYRRRRKSKEDQEAPPPMTPVLPLQRPRMSEVPFGPNVVSEVPDPSDVPRPFLTHSRGSSSASSAANSTTAILRDVPILSTPRPPSHARSTSSGSTPMRPSQRPPPLDFPG